MLLSVTSGSWATVMLSECGVALSLVLDSLYSHRYDEAVRVLLPASDAHRSNHDIWFLLG